MSSSTTAPSGSGGTLGCVLFGLLMLAFTGAIMGVTLHRDQERRQHIAQQGWHYESFGPSGYRIAGSLEGVPFVAEGTPGMEEQDDVLALWLPGGSGGPAWLGPRGLVVSRDTWLGERLLALYSPRLSEVIPLDGRLVERACPLPSELILLGLPDVPCPPSAVGVYLLRPGQPPYRLARSQKATVIYDFGTLPWTGPDIIQAVQTLSDIAARWPDAHTDW